MIVVECSNCGTELTRANNGSKETYTARLPCFDEGCGAEIRESETVAVQTPEDADAGFPAGPEEQSYLCHLGEISGNGVGDKD